MKILLVPDKPNWAFDNIAKSIIKYNPYPEKISYNIEYAKNLYEGTVLNLDDWDYIYVFYEAEQIIPYNEKTIRGCYSAHWIQNPFYSIDKLAQLFSKSAGVVFANEYLRNCFIDKLPINFPTTIIYDSSDESKFYPLPDRKQEQFTAIFVGDKDRKIKNFDRVKFICDQTNIKLLTCTGIPNDQLVYYYNQADICINFSSFEGGPQTFIEAGLCEVPMLIRENNELAKIIPCFMGKSEQDFINIINELKINRNKCCEIGKKAREIIMQDFLYPDTAKKFADFFLYQQDEKYTTYKKRDLSEHLTVFVISCGNNPNYQDCISAINNQSVKFQLKEIRNIAPMSQAFQLMIDECTTKYYIQIDEDMILDNDSIRIIYESLKSSNDNIAIVQYKLKDIHLNFDLFGVKGYKHEILKNYPYNLETISCEVEQVNRMKSNGYGIGTFHEILGLHSPKWTKSLIFERYFDLMEKWKIYKYDWLSELPSKLLEIFKKDSSEMNLFALMGALTSICTNELRNREKNFLIQDENFSKILTFLSTENYRYILPSKDNR